MALKQQRQNRRAQRKLARAERALEKGKTKRAERLGAKAESLDVYGNIDGVFTEEQKEQQRQQKINQQQALLAEQAKEKARRDAMPSLSTMYSGPLATKTSVEYNQQNPSTNGTGGGNPTFVQKDFNTMAAVADPSIKTAGSLFSKPVAPPMDDIQKSLQQKITSQT